MPRAAGLKLRIAAQEGTIYRADNLPVQAIFENRGTALIRLLRLFEPLPVFFEIDLVSIDGRSVDAPGAGKADIPPGRMNYVDLTPGGEFMTTLRLDSVVPAEDLRPGAYRLALTYHNQYGEGCFHGMRKSNRIMIEIARS